MRIYAYEVREDERDKFEQMKEKHRIDLVLS